MMTQTNDKIILTDLRGRIGVIQLNRPPANALSPELCAQLRAEITLLLADAAVDGVVLASVLGNFSAGSDTSDLTHPKAGNKAELAAVCALVGASNKPIVAAINGACLSAGLELALAAGARLAQPSAQFAFPDIRMGLMPAAGSTLRLPRLIGATAALEMLLEGGVLGAAQAQQIGLIDRIVPEDMLSAACLLAAEMAQGRAEPRRPVPQGRVLQEATLRARATYAKRRLAAYDRIISCVEAGQIFLPEQAFALELQSYDDLLLSPDSQGMCHALVSQQRCRSANYAPVVALPEGVVPQEVKQINILGSGELVERLATRALVAGLIVCVADKALGETPELAARVADLLVTEVAEGRLPAGDRDAALSRLRLSQDRVAFDEGAVFLGEGEEMDGGVALSAAPIGPPIGPPTGPPTGSKPAVLIMGPRGGRSWSHALDPAAPAQLAATLAGLFVKLGIKTYDLARGGALEMEIKETLSRAVSYLQGQGHSREAIIAALASSGVGVDSALNLPAAPPKSKVMLGAIHAALANRGARMLRLGMVARASDLDAVAVQAGFFPRWLGGPLYWADRRGPLVLRADLRKLAQNAPDLFTPDPTFDALIAKGQRFADLQATA